MSLNTILATAPLATTGFHIKATGTTLGNSLIWDNGTNVGIGNTNTSYTLDVSGTGRFTSTLLVSGQTTFTSANNGKIFGSTGATTGYQYAEIANTGGILNIGVASSTGVIWASGNGGAYNSVIGTANATDFVIGTNNIGRIIISSTGTTAFSNTVDVAVNVSNSTSGLNLVNNFGSGYGNSLNYYTSTTKFGSIQVESSAANTSEMAFKTMIASTVATRLFISSAGNVGIGTSSPTTKLTINDTGVYGSALNLVEGTFGAWVQGSTEGLTHAFIGNFKYNFTTPSSSFSYYSGTGYGIDMCDGIRFFSAQSNVTNGTFTPTERMRITSVGRLLLNTTSSTQGMLYSVAPANTDGITSQITSANFTAFVSIVPSGSYSAYWVCAGNTAGYIDHPTNTTTRYYTGPSDERLKSNIKNWDENVLDLFKDINPKTYNHNIDNDESIVYKGFIAQEMVDKFPEAYGKDREGFYSFNPSGYIPYLVKAIQEMNTKLDEQNQTIQNLQEQINILAK